MSKSANPGSNNELIGLDEYAGFAENCPINIVYCDRNLKITYANLASITMLRTIEQHLPIPVDKMIGFSIDAFHKNPAYQ